MKTKSFFFFFIVTIIVCGHLNHSNAESATPRVIKTIPNNGDTDVDFSLRHLSVTFDQDMSNSDSWVPIEGTFLQTTGLPRWKDRRTCTLPVRLKHNTQYLLSINHEDGGHIGFKNTKGIPAIPYLFIFRTCPKKMDLNQSVFTKEDNRKSIGELYTAIQEKYSYRDFYDIDWDKLFDTHYEEMEHAKTPKQFIGAVNKVLAQAKDDHIYLRVNDSYFFPFNTPTKGNCNPKILSQLIKDWKVHNEVVATGKLQDDVGYVAIFSWGQKHGKKAFGPAFDALKRFHNTTKALVIDVRLNPGGNFTPAADFAGCFIDKPKIYDKYRTVNPNSPTGFSKIKECRFFPNKDYPKYQGKVFVLMGKKSASASEQFILMMKQNPNSLLIGDNSSGTSGEPWPHTLSNGIIVYLPRSQNIPESFLKGIEPDIKVEFTSEVLRTRDPVLEKVVELLEK